MADASNSLNKCDVIATMLVKVRSRLGLSFLVIPTNMAAMCLSFHSHGKGWN